MSTAYIEGFGVVAIDPNKSQAEKNATIDYYTNIAPKYQQDIGGFSDGFNDTQSMIFRWGQKIFGTPDEE